MSDSHHSVEEQHVETAFGLRVTDFLRRHGRRLALLASVIAVLGLVVAFWMIHRREMAAAGFAAVSRADDPESFGAVASQYRGTPAAVLAAFLEGNALLDAARYEEAGQALESFLAGHPSHMFAPDAEFLLAIAQEGMGSVEEALRQYAKVAERDGHPRAAEALASAARCQEALGRPAEARRLLEDLLARHPGSVWAADAREDLVRVRASARDAPGGPAPEASDELPVSPPGLPGGQVEPLIPGAGEIPGPVSAD